MEASPTGQGQHFVLSFFGDFKMEQIYKRVDFCPITPLIRQLAFMYAIM